ncbi:MAG TPA: sigma factor [Ktedonosporobacter sp.]|nr:sigma factor [Ktedonosporobacter sp.]
MMKDLDLFLLESLRQAAPMLQHLACWYRVDFEDLYQDAAVVALERAEQARVRGRAWLHATLRGEALNTITRKRGPIALQLDMAINEEGDRLPSTLEAPPPVVVDEQREDTRTLALYEALWRLPLEEQIYLQRVFRLEAFHPRPNDFTYRRQTSQHRGRNSVSASVFKRLRRDRKLSATILEEVPS